jgi:ParB family chromosome partitioning protein
MSTLTTPTLPIADIKIDASVNPRLDIDADALAELVASIKEHGVLQPLLVRPKADGKGYDLVAGARRLAAAKKAGLKEVPVHAADLNGGALAAAIVENVIREDLTPVEEAEALAELQDREKLSLRDLGKRVGKSKDYVAQRLRIRELPDKAKAAIGETVSLHEIPNIVKVAKQSPAAAEAIATAGVNLETDHQLERALSTVARDGKASVWSTHGIGLATLPVDDAKQLAARYKKATAVTGYYGRESVYLEDKYVNAARAFGCLLEVGRGQYVTDGVWLAEQVREIVAAEEKKAERELKKRGKPAPAASSADAEAKAKEQRRKEREAEERKRKELRGANLELGRKTLEAFHKPKVTVELMQLLAHMAFDDQFTAIAGRGWRYVDESMQTEEAQKNGKAKITYAAPDAAGKALQKAIDAAKTPEEVAGVVTRALIYARYASDEVLAPSNRFPWNLRSEHYTAFASSKGALAKLVDKVATSSKVIPAKLKRRGQK